MTLATLFVKKIPEKNAKTYLHQVRCLSSENVRICINKAILDRINANAFLLCIVCIGYRRIKSSEKILVIVFLLFAWIVNRSVQEAVWTMLASNWPEKLKWPYSDKLIVNINTCNRFILFFTFLKKLLDYFPELQLQNDFYNFICQEVCWKRW